MHNLDELPTEWLEYIHVDGKPYFRHTVWGVVTEEYIREPTTRTKLENWYHQVNNVRMKKGPGIVSESFELYLTLTPHPAYYFVDHATRSLFWLEDLSLDQLKGNSSKTFMSFGKRSLA